AQPGDDVVQPPLQQRHQGVAGVPRPAGRLLVVLAGLALEDLVVPLDLLLLPQADGVLAGLAAAELVHPGHAVAAVDGALGGIAPRPFQEQLRALAPAEPTNRSNMTSHGGSTTLGHVNQIISYSIVRQQARPRPMGGKRSTAEYAEIAEGNAERNRSIFPGLTISLRKPPGPSGSSGDATDRGADRYQPHPDLPL